MYLTIELTSRVFLLTPHSLLLTPHSSLAAIPDLGLLVVKLLAVVGGVAVGAFGCGVFLKLMARLIVRQKVPRSMLGVTRLLGGIAGGLLVWAWVFSIGGQGGMGGSGGGWWPFGQGGGKGPGEVEPQAQAPPPVEKPEPPELPPPASAVLTIDMLGGARVRDQRFYVIDHAPPRTWDELRAALAARKQQDPALRAIDVRIFKDSVDQGNPAVTELVRWAQANGLTPRLSILPENMPQETPADPKK
jgi:hypothetical protein